MINLREVMSMTERKVLFTASTYSHIRSFHLPYLAEFARLGWTVDVACGGTPMELPGARRVIPVPFEKSMTSPKNLAAVRLLRREIRREGYELVSCHTALASFFTRLAVKGMGHRPLVACTAHGYLFDGDTPAPKRTVLLGAERLCAPVTDLLMTMNAWDDQLAREKKLGRRIVNIPGMGVDFARMSALPQGAGEALRGEYGFGAEHFLLVYAAEFSQRKNQAMLLRTLPALPEQVCLLLPGDGALRASCMELARTLGVEKRVVFPGHVGDMPRWYAAADAAVSASRSEGLPFHMMEAMYRGLPVVASAVKGHTDLIEDGVSGLLYPFVDEAAFAAAVERLLNDRKLAAAMGAAGRRAVESRALPVVLPRVMDAYRQLIDLEQREVPGKIG